MPVFTIKGKDALAVPTIKRYRELCVQFGLELQAEQVTRAINEIADWQRRNIEQTKLPDHPHRPVSAA